MSPNPIRALLQDLGWLQTEADTRLENDTNALAAVGAAAGCDVPPGVAAARSAAATLDGVRELLSKEALLAAILLREQEVSVCGHTLLSS